MSNGTASHGTRTKRSETYNETHDGALRELLRLSHFIEVLSNVQSSAHDEHSVGHRYKRDTSHYLNDVVHEIQMELETLESSLDLAADVNGSAESLSSAGKFGVKCFIENTGKVNCSSVIYENEKSWKKSRDQVDLLIQVLKTKIVELKDIRRHLKEHKPRNVTDDDDDEDVGGDIGSEEDASENALAFTEVNDEVTQNVDKSLRRGHHNHSANHPSKRPHRMHSTTETMVSSPSTILSTWKPQSTTSHVKITSTAMPDNRTHTTASRRNHQQTRGPSTPRIQNVENTHRHHHQHHVKNANASHPTRPTKAHENGTNDLERKLNTNMDQSRAECFCEPDVDKWVADWCLHLCNEFN